jgi:K+-sensing histidine kinase KdpD
MLNDLRSPGPKPDTSRFRPTDATALAGDAEDTLTHLVAALMRALDVQIGFVAVPDNDGLMLTGQVSDIPSASGWRVIPAEDSLSGTALAERQAVLVDDLRTDPLTSESSELRLFGAVGFAAVPLRAADGAVLGVLGAGTRNPRLWNERDRRILFAMASAIALILGNRSTIHSTANLGRIVAQLVEPLQALTDQVRRLTTLVTEHGDARLRRFAGRAATQVQLVEQLMREIQEATRPDPDEGERRDRQTDLVAVVRRSIKSSEDATAFHRFQFAQDAPPLVVQCHPLDLERSVTDLLVNLTQYVPEAAGIDLRVVEGRETVRLDIIALGVGIHAAELVRMLSRFKLGAPSMSGALQLVGGVIFADRGVIRARSSPRATAFRIRLARG